VAAEGEDSDAAASEEPAAKAEGGGAAAAIDEESAVIADDTALGARHNAPVVGARGERGIHVPRVATPATPRHMPQPGASQ